jgi:hypothetical protein
MNKKSLRSPSSDKTSKSFQLNQVGFLEVSKKLKYQIKIKKYC